MDAVELARVRPALLLFPTFPDGSVDVLQGVNMSVARAREWICGDAPIRVKVHGDGIYGYINRPNSGTRLVGAVASRTNLDKGISDLQQDRETSPDILESHRRTIELIAEQLDLEGNRDQRSTSCAMG